MNIVIKRDLDGVNWPEVAALYWHGMTGNKPLCEGYEWEKHLRITQAEFEGSGLLCLAYLDGRCVGGVHAVTDRARDAAIYGLVVHPEYRRRGVATPMIRELLNDLRDVAVVLHASEQSERIFQRLGFRPLQRAMGLRYGDADLTPPKLAPNQHSQTGAIARVRPAGLTDLSPMQWAPDWAKPTERHFHDGHVFVAETGNGQLPGILIFNRSFYDRPFIASLYVKASFRRRGIGASLVQHVEQISPGQKLFTSTSLCNTAMQALLAKRGFQLSGAIEKLGPQPELIYFKKCEVS